MFIRLIPVLEIKGADLCKISEINLLFTLITTPTIALHKISH